MKNQNIWKCALLFSIALPASFPVCSAQNLPNAPQPLEQGPVPATPLSSNSALLGKRWSGIVEPGQNAPPLTVREKLLYPAHEENPLISVARAVYSGGYGILVDSDPKLGINREGFGERVGESALRLAITRELSDSFLPIAFHQDPRYYRQGVGSYGSRAEHAVSRIVFAQSDSGTRMLNYSDVLGRGMNAALTQAYYPEASIRPSVVFRTWAVSIAVLGSSKILDEFWPDVKMKLRHKKQ